MRNTSILSRNRHASSRRFIAVIAGAAMIAAAFLAASFLFSACSSKLTARLELNGSVRLSLAAEVPAAISAKLRSLAGSPSTTAPLFDAAAMRKAAAERPGMRISRLNLPTPDSVDLELTIADLAVFLSTPDLADGELLTLTRGQGWTELRVRLARGQAGTLSSILPGVDPYLIEALAPPALEEEPLSAEEYATVLKSVLGDKAAEAFEAGAMHVKIEAPAAVLGSGGGQVSGRALDVSMALLDLLVLEEPVEFWLRWKS
jgi:hypothetical protein